MPQKRPGRHGAPGRLRQSVQQAQNADDNQIDRNDVVKDARKDQDQDACDKRHDRLDGDDVDLHGG